MPPPWYISVSSANLVHWLGRHGLMSFHFQPAEHEETQTDVEQTFIAMYGSVKKLSTTLTFNSRCNKIKERENTRRNRKFISLQSQQSVGTTVFHVARNFEPSHGICPFPRNFYVFPEFCGIQYWEQIQHIVVEFRPLYCMYT